nr:UBX domain-containing protein 1-like [Penaeus vannamei]
MHLFPVFGYRSLISYRHVCCWLQKSHFLLPCLLKKALAVTGGGGVEQAMEWLLAHADDPGINDPPAEDVTGAAAGHSLGSQEGSEKMETSEYTQKVRSPGAPSPAQQKAEDDQEKLLQNSGRELLKHSISQYCTYSCIPPSPSPLLNSNLFVF